MTRPATIAADDPYASIRRKLQRMAPLVDLDRTLARNDVQVLEVRSAGQVQGIAVLLKNAPRLCLQLYYADDAPTARTLMARLNEVDHAAARANI